MTETEFKEQFGEKLKKKIDEYPMTQKELACETGLGESLISRYISGKYMPNLKNTVKLAQALCCDIEDFVDMNQYVE